MSAPWSITNFPATATAATASQAAPTNAATTGLCTRLRSLTATLSCGATAATPAQVVVRDGATGVGTIIWNATLAAPANGAAMVNVSGLDLRSTVGNSLTVEFVAASAAATQQAISAQGDFVSAGYPAFASAAGI